MDWEFRIATLLPTSRELCERIWIKARNGSQDRLGPGGLVVGASPSPRERSGRIIGRHARKDARKEVEDPREEGHRKWYF